jgi:ABC-type transport system involved in cytochrome c biogenesis permease subunit
MNSTDQSSSIDENKNKGKKINVFKIAASLKLTVVCLVLLTLLVVWGTVYQAEHGLYQAQQKFFHSWMFWIGGVIPFPGTVLVMFVLFFNLVAVVIFRIGFRLSKIGNIITHVGILILLVGGFFTFYFSEESSLMLKEGEGSAMSASTHLWELAVWQAGEGDIDVYAIDTAGFRPGKTFRFGELNLELTVKDYYANCTIDNSSVHAPRVLNASGIQHLKGTALAQEASDNTAGGVFVINPAPGENQPLLLFGRDNDPTRVTVEDGTFFFSIRRKKIPLPLYMTLQDFKVKFYPNSNIPKSYESKVNIQAEGGLEREVVISMNKPLRFKDYTFFQSGYNIMPDGTEYTNLAVVKNIGRLLPYYSSITIFLGLVIHFLVMLFKRKRKGLQKIMIVFIGLGLWFSMGDPLLYSQVDSLEHLRKTVILENGRKMPLDTYARNLLKQFSGRSTFQKESAVQWLARVLFTPEASYDDKIFLITNPEVLDSIGVDRQGKARDRYGFSQLRPGYAKLRQLAINASRINDKDRSFIENEILSLYNKLFIYQRLLASFDFLMPHPDFTVVSGETREILDLPGENIKKHLSYFDLAERKARIRDVTDSLKDKSQEEWTAPEKEIFALSQRLEQWARFYSDLPLTIIPSFVKKGEKEEKWLSPWDIAGPVILDPSPSASIPGSLFLMRDFTTAYWNHDQAAFDKSVTAFNRLIREQAGDRIRPNAISGEVFYNKVDPFYKAKFFYGFSFLFLLLSFLILRKWLYRLAFVLLLAGFGLHLFGMVCRMYIRLRPPVTNLYETFIFTGLIAVLLGLILEFFKKKNIGVATGSLAGLVMLMIAGKYALEGDTMGMLVAVLDSNFWLAAHVTTIILGYAGVLLSGFIGHVYVIQRIFKPHKEELLKNTFQAVYAIQAFGIIFTFLGTVLGGIWADQSWGRFWGWDPKENGALLILLWSAILFHARLAGWVREIGFSLGTVVGVITVALAWFGVNLLGVGLHSYGFTSGVANALFIFIIFELLFIIVTLMVLKADKKLIKNV